MPRQARQASGTGIYHVMMRGIKHQNIFEEQEDYYQFLNTLDLMRLFIEKIEPEIVKIINDPAITELEFSRQYVPVF